MTAKVECVPIQAKKMKYLTTLWILSATGLEVLQNAETITHEQAEQKANSKYKKYIEKTPSHIEKNKRLEPYKILDINSPTSNNLYLNCDIESLRKYVLL